jgi:hypothetical protein
MIRMTPRTMTAVPRMSVAVTAEQSEKPLENMPDSEPHSRVPTSQRAKMKLKIRALDPSGATQSGRRYLRAIGEPTEKCQT